MDGCLSKKKPNFFVIIILFGMAEFWKNQKKKKKNRLTTNNFVTLLQFVIRKIQLNVVALQITNFVLKWIWCSQLMITNVFLSVYSINASNYRKRKRQPQRKQPNWKRGPMQQLKQLRMLQMPLRQLCIPKWPRVRPTLALVMNCSLAVRRAMMTTTKRKCRYAVSKWNRSRWALYKDNQHLLQHPLLKSVK